MRAHLISNAKSGKGKGAELVEIADKLCRELGHELINHVIDGPQDFEKRSREALEAARQDGGIVLAAGGDGTLRGVAQVVHGTGVRFGAIPIGTFNFFARTHRIPEDPEEALRLALTGQPRPVRLGRVNGEIFLINASLGLYAKAIRDREKRTSRYGRNRLVVILSTIASLFSKHLLLRVDLVSEKKTSTYLTPMIFIGNNALQLRDLAMDVARCMKQDLLAVVLMKRVTKFETLRIILRGIFKTIENDERMESFCVETLTIHTHRPAHTVALDGEMFTMQSPLKVEALPESLNLVLPPKETSA